MNVDTPVPNSLRRAMTVSSRAKAKEISMPTEPAGDDNALVPLHRHAGPDVLWIRCRRGYFSRPRFPKSYHFSHPP